MQLVHHLAVDDERFWIRAVVAGDEPHDASDDELCRVGSGRIGSRRDAQRPPDGSADAGRLLTSATRGTPVPPLVREKGIAHAIEPCTRSVQ